MKVKKLKNETKEQFIERATNLYYSDGYHLSEIADKLKCSKLTVYGIISKNGNKMITTEEERELMIALRDQDFSYRAIGKILHKSHTCVRRRIMQPAKHHITESYDYKLSDKQLNHLKEWYKEGKTMAWIARQLNISNKSVKYRLVKANIYDPNLSVPLTIKEKLTIKTMRATGKTISEIAITCGRKYSTIAKYLNDINNVKK